MNKPTKLKIKCFRCGKHIGNIITPNKVDGYHDTEISNIKHDEEYYFMICDDCIEKDEPFELIDK